MKYGFKIDHVGYLDENGRLTEELPPFAKDPDELVRMYKMMVTMRVLDQKAVNMFKVGQIGTYPSSLGEEAIDIALGYALEETPGNFFAPYYRNHGTLLVRDGIDVFLQVLLYWGGDERGNTPANPESYLSYVIPIGTQYAIAVGVAKGRRLLKKEGVVMVVGGDGSTSKGDFNNALNEAAVEKLPVVFVIKNNRWAISTPVAEQTATHPLALRGSGFAIPSTIVDGNDVIAVREVASLAIRHAREGHGPVLIEAQTYRLADHTTVDNAKEYRDQEEVDHARKSEPLLRMKKFLIERKCWSDEDDARLIAEVGQKATELQNAYLAYPRQQSADLVNYLFESLPDVSSYREQLAQLIKRGV